MTARRGRAQAPRQAGDGRDGPLVAALLRVGFSQGVPAGCRPLRVIIIGEFNAGKTSLINSLLEKPLLPTGIVSSTAIPTVIGFAAEPRLAVEASDRRHRPLAWDDLHRLQGPTLENGVPRGIPRRLHIGLPLERLKRMRLIDTPGLAAGNAIAEAQTRRACCRADVIVWCTPAWQAWKRSEESAWLRLPQGVRRRGLLAITFADAIPSPAAADQLLRRLREAAGAYFHEIVLIKARDPATSPLPAA
jgi:hypothetical protein